MITTLLLNILYLFLQALFGTLSSALTFTGLSEGLNSFFAWVLQFNALFPVDTLYRYLGYTIDFWLAVLGFDIVKWVAEYIRGK